MTRTRAKDLLLQCSKCGATGTMYHRDGVKALPVFDGRQEAVQQAWNLFRKLDRQGDGAGAQKALRRMRDLRYGKPVLLHLHCGGTCHAYDLDAA